MKKSGIFLLGIMCVPVVGCNQKKGEDNAKLFYAFSTENLLSDWDYMDRENVDNEDFWDRDYTMRFNALRNENDAAQLMIHANKNIESFDFTLPTFQNFIVDMNLQASIKDMLVLSVGEKINVFESKNDCKNFIPSIGLIFKFSFDVKNNDYLASRDWSQSEMTVSAAYKNMYENIHAISAGVDIDLGMKDTAAPEIIIWKE